MEFIDVDWIDVSEDPLDVGFYWVLVPEIYEVFRNLYKGDGFWERNGHTHWTLYTGPKTPRPHINR